MPAMMQVQVPAPPDVGPARHWVTLERNGRHLRIKAGGSDERLIVLMSLCVD